MPTPVRPVLLEMLPSHFLTSSMGYVRREMSDVRLVRRHGWLNLTEVKMLSAQAQGGEAPLLFLGVASGFWLFVFCHE